MAGLSTTPSEGWRGWDAYAPFYDWENARTLGRRDVAFWQGVAAGAGGEVLELGCGTGRISIPLQKRGGSFGIDLVPDVPNWREYRNQVQLRCKAAGGARLTLVESVRQDRRRHLTTFEQRYHVRRGGKTSTHRFELTFRTLSVAQMT